MLKDEIKVINKFFGDVKEPKTAAKPSEKKPEKAPKAQSITAERASAKAEKVSVTFSEAKPADMKS